MVLSHFFNPGEAALALERMFLNGPMRSGGRFRARVEIAEYLTEPDPARSLMLGAVAIKP